MLKDYTGLLTGDEWFVEAVNERGWLLTVWARSTGHWFIAEIHNVQEKTEAHLAPIGHYEGRSLKEVCRDAYLEAIGELEPWTPPRYENANF